MRNFRNIFFALAAFLWLPASAHCDLESLTHLTFLQCSIQESGPGPAAPVEHCACCSLEKAQYRAEKAPSVISVPQVLSIVTSAILAEVNPKPVEAGVGLAVLSPPEIRNHWLCFSRTALPVRAPSFVL